MRTRFWWEELCRIVNLEDLGVKGKDIKWNIKEEKIERHLRYFSAGSEQDPTTEFFLINFGNAPTNRHF
jgi:hypothetical protein